MTGGSLHIWHVRRFIFNSIYFLIYFVCYVLCFIKCTNRHAPSRPFTPLHAPSRPFTPLHAPSRPVAPLHAPSRPFTPLHAPSRPFTPLHAPSRPFTPLHAPSHPFRDGVVGVASTAQCRLPHHRRRSVLRLLHLRRLHGFPAEVPRDTVPDEHLPRQHLVRYTVAIVDYVNLRPIAPRDLDNKTSDCLLT